MAEQAVQTVLFPELFDKPLGAPFDTPHQSSDGGAILLKAIDDELGLTARLAACLPERRQEGKIAHALPTLIRQRCYGLACDYAGPNDAARLTRPTPSTSSWWAAIGWRAIPWRPSPPSPALKTVSPPGTSYALAGVVIATHQARLGARRVQGITIDPDSTDNPTHGQQEFSFFNSHYGT